MVDFSASCVRAPVVNAEDHLAVKPRRQDGPVKLGKSVGFFGQTNLRFSQQKH